jgi:mannose-6-phosphate isomerase
VEQFFPGLTAQELGRYGTELSPKILAVEPGQQLSLQYHRRRAEVWQVIAGPVLVALSSERQQQGVWVAYESGQRLQVPPMTTHRLAVQQKVKNGVSLQKSGSTPTPDILQTKPT